MYRIPDIKINPEGQAKWGIFRTPPQNWEKVGIQNKTQKLDRDNLLIIDDIVEPDDAGVTTALKYDEIQDNSEE